MILSLVPVFAALPRERGLLRLDAQVLTDPGANSVARDGAAIKRLRQLTVTALHDSEFVLVDAPPGRSVFDPNAD